ncbi:MAG: hypothetical protein ACK55Z_26625, partial [bacterium]
MGLRSHRRQITPRPQGHGSPPDPLPTGTSSPLQPGTAHHHSSATHLLEFSARWYPETFGDRYWNTSMGPPTPAGGQPAASSPPGMYGKVSPQTSQHGQK